MSTTSSQSGFARVKRPERGQIQWRPLALDQLLPSDHRARLVWQFVESLNLAPLYGEIRAVEGVAGRDAVDPRLLMALWLFATIEGVGSARQLARLCERDLAYLWLCGEVTVNYHLLSDFRTAHADFLDRLLTDSVAALMHQELVTLEGVAQDGMRVRAHAGSSSFRRRATLEKCQREAREHVERLRQQGVEEAAADSRRQAAQERAARACKSRGPCLGGTAATGRTKGTARTRDEPEGTGLDDRSPSPFDEDGRRRLSPGVQRAIGDRRGLARDRRR